MTSRKTAITQFRVGVAVLTRIERYVLVTKGYLTPI